MEKNGENSVEQQWATTFDDIGRSIADVGGYMRTALRETARQIGGEPFEQTVLEKAGQDPFLPDVAALALLNEYDPGATEIFWRYTKRAQEDAFRQDWLHLGKTSLKRLFRLDVVSQ